MVHSLRLLVPGMRNTHFPTSVLAAALSACATESVILNSERIENRFGSYGIEVLASEAGLRRSSLLSYDGDAVDLPHLRRRAVRRAARRVRYDDAHSKVLAGNSIGEPHSGKTAGECPQDATLYIGSSSTARSLARQVGELMRSDRRPRSSHCTSTDSCWPVLKASHFEYATILEVAPSRVPVRSRILRGICSEHDARNDLPARLNWRQLSAAASSCRMKPEPSRFVVPAVY